jgi:hypothetical protein
VRRIATAGLAWASAVGIVLAVLRLAPCAAQTVAGDRIFLATPRIGEPGVADQFTLPTTSWSDHSDGVRDIDTTANFSKRLTEDWGIVVASGWTHLAPGGNGFQNLDTTLKYVPVVDAADQFILCLGLAVDWGGSGAARTGANPFSTVTPQLYFGKGLGDASQNLAWLRPLSVTGQFGLGFPTQSRSTTRSFSARDGAASSNGPNPTVFNWGFTLQYDANQPATGSPSSAPLGGHLAPLVEFVLQSPVADLRAGVAGTTGTINPGLVYVAKTFQITVEALVPVNAASGRHVGGLVAVNFSLDQIFPTGLGKPLFP